MYGEEKRKNFLLVCFIVCVGLFLLLVCVCLLCLLLFVMRVLLLLFGVMF